MHYLQQHLSAEEQEQVEITATSWNLERGLPDNVKARYLFTDAI